MENLKSFTFPGELILNLKKSCANGTELGVAGTLPPAWPWWQLAGPSLSHGTDVDSGAAAAHLQTCSTCPSRASPVCSWHVGALPPPGLLVTVTLIRSAAERLPVLMSRVFPGIDGGHALWAGTARARCVLRVLGRGTWHPHYLTAGDISLGRWVEEGSAGIPHWKLVLFPLTEMWMGIGADRGQCAEKDNFNATNRIHW